MIRNPSAMERPGFDPSVGAIPQRRAWGPTQVFLPEEFHGQKNRFGYSPWGHKESDTIQQLNHHLVFLHIYSLGRRRLRLPSNARLEVRNAGPGLSSVTCCCVACSSILQALNQFASFLPTIRGILCGLFLFPEQTEE